LITPFYLGAGLGVLIGEMFSSQRGLGFLLVNGMAQNNVPLSTAIVTVIVAIAIAANTLMLRAGRRFARRPEAVAR
jgi:NitT/TauT family transport system permease protein